MEEKYIDDPLYNAKFEEVAKEIDRINGRLDKVENNYNNLDKNLLKMELMVGNLESKFDKVETNLENKLSKLDGKLDTFIASFNNDKEKEIDKKDKRTYEWLKYVGTAILSIIFSYIAMKLNLQ